MSHKNLQPNEPKSLRTSSHRRAKKKKKKNKPLPLYRIVLIADPPRHASDNTDKGENMSGKNYPVKDLANAQKERKRLEKLNRKNKDLDEEIKALERKRDALAKRLQEIKAKRRNEK